MKRILFATALSLVLAACGSRFQPIGAAVNQGQISSNTEELGSPASQVENDPAGEPSSASEDLPAPEEAVAEATAIAIPTLPAPDVVYEEPEPSEELAVVTADIGVFATMPDNIATGLEAPDFNVRALENSKFTLSAARGSYVLVFPTVIGCGDCVFTMGELAAAYSDYQDQNMTLVLLNIYPEDVPETWGEFIDLYPDLDAVWGVIDSVDFVVNYEIRSLGTILLIDPDGRLVFRRNFPLVEDEFRQLFSLATR